MALNLVLWVQLHLLTEVGLRFVAFANSSLVNSHFLNGTTANSNEVYAGFQAHIWHLTLHR